MDVGAALAVAGIGFQRMDGAELTVFIPEDVELVAEFAEQVGEFPVGAERAVARAGDVEAAEFPGEFIFTERMCAAGALETVDRIGTQVIDKYILPVRGKDRLVDVRGDVLRPGGGELPVLRLEHAVIGDREDGHGTAGVVGRDQMPVQQQDIARIAAFVGPVRRLPVQQVDAVFAQPEGVGALPAVVELADAIGETPVFRRDDERRILAPGRVQQREFRGFLVELV